MWNKVMRTTVKFVRGNFDSIFSVNILWNRFIFHLTYIQTWHYAEFFVYFANFFAFHSPFAGHPQRFVKFGSILRLQNVCTRDYVQTIGANNFNDKCLYEFAGETICSRVSANNRRHWDFFFIDAYITESTEVWHFAGCFVISYFCKQTRTTSHQLQLHGASSHWLQLCCRVSLMDFPCWNFRWMQIQPFTWKIGNYNLFVFIRQVNNSKKLSSNCGNSFWEEAKWIR